MYSKHEQFVIAQTRILKVTGFLPFRPYSLPEKITKYLLRITCLVILTGTFLFASFKVTEIAFHLQTGFAGYSQKNGFLLVLAYLPDTAITMRSFLVLLAFYLKRHALEDVVNDVTNLTNACLLTGLIQTSPWQEIYKRSVINLFIKWGLRQRNAILI